MALDETPGDHILSLFDPEDSERAADIYFRFLEKLIWYFDRHNCEDPEDLAHETLFRVEKAVASGKEVPRERVFGYSWSVAEHVRSEAWKRRKRQMSEPLEDHPSLSTGSSSSLETIIYVDECVKKALTSEERELLRSNYLDGAQRTATRHGMTLPQLRLKLHRIRKKVQKVADSPTGQKGMSA